MRRLRLRTLTLNYTLPAALEKPIEELTVYEAILWFLLYLNHRRLEDLEPARKAMELALEAHQDDWNQAMPAFVESRMANSNAIADMALENYVEMRATVNDPKFHLKKAIAFELEKRLPDYFIPRYSMVMFHRIPYAEVFRRGKIQAEILDELVANGATPDNLDERGVAQLVNSRLVPGPPVRI